MDKLLKYKILRHFPGELGHRYECKLMVQTNGFEKSLLRSEGMTCIDLGANLGKFTRKMALRAKQVIAFEPDPWTFATLTANVADLDNVRVENAAAGTREGMARLYRHPRFDEDPILYSESSSTIATKKNVNREDAIEVREFDFISFLYTLDEEIGVLKIDIEGAEVDLLEALLDSPIILSRIKYIFAETHENGFRTIECA